MPTIVNLIKDWQKRIECHELYFSQIIEEMPSDQYFAFGAASGWIFLGNKEMFDRDIDDLDLVYWNSQTPDRPHVAFLTQMVESIYVRHWEDEHAMVLIKLEGMELGLCTFERDYAPFLEVVRHRVRLGKRLPKTIYIDREGNLIKRELVLANPKMYHGSAPKPVIIYDKQGNEVRRCRSMKQAAGYMGISWIMINQILMGEREHPQYDVRYDEDEEDSEEKEDN